MRKSEPARTFLMLSFFLSSLAFLPAETLPPFTGWKQASTNHFRFVFEDASRPQMEALARIADTAWNRISQTYSTPPEMTDVIVTARTDTVNAFAEGLNLYMGFFTSPPLSPDFGYRADWPTLLFTHELTHIANFSFEGKESAAVRWFGPFWNITNFAGLPGWSVEGLTTVLETELTPGGRGRSPWFELYFKAATLENSFIEYSAIGTEKQPPKGQIYIMGYLLMRSIADRYGIGALADIERNRTSGRDFAESVALVTGHTPDELFRDVRIALTKRYAAERGIPEGRTITPRTLNTFFYRPALVTGTTGEIIAIRDAKDSRQAAVRYDPAAGKETVLFEADFADTSSLAAGDDGTVIAALKSARRDRLPGFEVSTDLYSWTEAGGLSKLTSGTSLFQPALSRSGNRLVAVEQVGIRYRLVEVNLKTGELLVLADLPGKSCIRPALSADGSELAFLSLDGTRAALATAHMPKYRFAYPVPESNIQFPVNASGPVIDIGEPSWTADGSLLYASNERGRLEVWEYRDGRKRPVVSDPVGAFWADRTAQGICYASCSGTGNVLKLKPADQWGVVPEFAGPSAPGEIVTLGSLSTDFPSFNPYPGSDDALAGKNGPKPATNAATPSTPGAAPRTGPAAASGAAGLPSGTAKNGKDRVIPRPDGTRETGILTEPAGEKGFTNFPRPQMWLPVMDYIPLDGDRGEAGAGAFMVAQGYPLQSGTRTTLAVAGGVWYPRIGQASAFAFTALPLHTGELLAYAGRELAVDSGNGDFIELSQANISWSLPVRNRSFYRDLIDIAVVTGAHAIAERTGEEAFSASADLPFRTGISGSLGLDAYLNRRMDGKKSLTARGTMNLILSRFPSLTGRTYLGGELYLSSSAGTDHVQGELGVRSRWYDYPEGAAFAGTLAAPRGESLDCRYPFRSLFQAAIVFPAGLRTRLFTEKLVSGGTGTAGQNTPDNGTPFNLRVDPAWYLGSEIEAEAGRMRFATGFVSRVGNPETFRFLADSHLYVTVKIDAFQGNSR